MQWGAEHGVDVQWVARPLKDFEDQPLEELAGSYDLVLMDYPFTGTAATSGLILPVNDWADGVYLADQQANSVGPSFASYTWNGQQWALAIDAACQVSARREDLWPGSGFEEGPQSWADVAGLAERLAGTSRRVAVPLNPNHAYCAFLSVGFAEYGPAFWPPGACFDQAAGCEALQFLKALAPRLHPLSREADPIAISDRMAETDEIAYVPLMFGYSSYARRGFRTRPLDFADAPSGTSGARGSVLGGVGLALSAMSEQREQAAALARTIGAGEVQRGIYVDSGGQPGHATAWESDRANAQTGGFFRATRDTMEQAFVRPRVPGHRPFQPAAGQLVHDFLWRDGRSAGRCMQAVLRLYEEHLEDWGAIEGRA